MPSVGFFGGKFLPFHLGHLYSIIEAHNQVDKLYVILSSSPNRDKELCDRDGIKQMPANTRLSWLGEALHDLDNVEVLHLEDDQWDDDYNWSDGAKMITNMIPEKITHVFSSEEAYSKLFNKFYPYARHVVIDDQRNTVTVSATELRQNLYKHWEKLPNYVKAHFVKRVLLTGTESVGKSTLTKKLAKFYNTNFVHEVGRDYCDRYKNQLTYEMFDFIAMEHRLLQEKRVIDSDKILFVDSDAIVTSYYFKMYFDFSSSVIKTIAYRQEFDLYLYLEPDVLWVDDGVRFAGKPEVREKNNILLKHLYKDRGSELTLITGDYSERFLKARQAVESLFKEGDL